MNSDKHDQRVESVCMGGKEGGGGGEARAVEWNEPQWAKVEVYRRLLGSGGERVRERKRAQQRNE